MIGSVGILWMEVGLILASNNQISTLSGQLVQPWSCYDPENGLGTYGVGPFAQTFCINYGCDAPTQILGIVMILIIPLYTPRHYQIITASILEQV